MKIIGRPAPPVMAVTTLLMSFSFSQPAIAANLGVANDYNVFVFGDAHQQWTDSEGSVAVGGNATYESFYARMDPNSPLPSQPSPGGHALLVGQDLTFNGGTANGDVTVGGTATLNNVNVMGQVNQGASLAAFFSQAEQELKGLSASLHSLSATAVGSNAYQNWIFNGTSGLNIFDIAASDWSQASSLQVNAPSDATVVFNVTGSGVTVTNHGMSLNGGITNSKILFNLHDANAVTFNNYGIQGSVLAPYATVNGHWGQINGNLIAANLFNVPLSGALSSTSPNTMQSNNALFAGDLPDPNAAVPTPALLPGLLGFAAAMRQRMKQGTV